MESNSIIMIVGRGFRWQEQRFKQASAVDCLRSDIQPGVLLLCDRSVGERHRSPPLNEDWLEKNIC